MVGLEFTRVLLNDSFLVGALAERSEDKAIVKLTADRTLGKCASMES